MAEDIVDRSRDKPVWVQFIPTWPGERGEDIETYSDSSGPDAEVLDVLAATLTQLPLLIGVWSSSGLRPGPHRGNGGQRR